MNARKWTAAVTVAGQDFTDMLDQRPINVFGDEPEGLNDTLKDVTDAAVALAAELLGPRYEAGSDASVSIFKQLKNDDEPRWDRGIYVYRDWDRNGDAVIRVQR